MRETKRDNLPDLAAGLTYYALLSIFPMLLAVLSILGLFGESATRPLIDNLRELAPGPARDTVITAVENLQRSQGAAGVLFVVSLAGALWSASRYFAAFMRAANVIYEVDEGRPIWKKIPVRLGMTVVLAIALVAATLAVAVTGDLAGQAGELLGLDDTAVTVWNFAKWPVAIVLVALLLALLYWAAPNVRHPGFRWLTPGAVLAIVVWVAGPRRSWPRPASPTSTSWPPPIRAASSPDSCQDGPTGDSPMSRCSAPGSGRRWGLSVASGGRRPRCRSDARRFRSRLGRSGRDARTWPTLIRVVVADRVSRCRKRSTTTSPSRPVGSVRRSDDTTQRAYGEAKPRPSTPDTDPTE